MFTITIDVSVADEVAGQLELAALTLRDAIPQQLAFLQSVWVDAVSGGRTLPGMSRELRDDRYAASIGGPESLQYPFDGDEFEGAVVAVDGRLAMRVEDGYASFDMKPGLLAGPAAKVSKKGTRYTTVPFTHSTPGSKGQKGAPMPGDVYAQAKALPAGGRLTGFGTYGMRSKLPAGVNAQAALRGRPPVMARPYTWRASPYEGMTRVHKPGHTTYMTFRRVSEESAPDSWIHPGVAANPVIRAVADYAGPIVQERLLAAVIAALS